MLNLIRKLKISRREIEIEVLETEMSGAPADPVSIEEITQLEEAISILERHYYTPPKCAKSSTFADMKELPDGLKPRKVRKPWKGKKAAKPL